MNTTLKNLIRLQELTRLYEHSGHPASQHKRIVHLRGSLPPNLLRRFDHLTEHGRLPVAQVSASGACGSCHLKLTASDVLRLRHVQESNVETVSLCPFCGCFLYSPTAAADSKQLTVAGL